MSGYFNSNLNEKQIAKTGILLRRYEKEYFSEPGNEPEEGEIVYAIDTKEFGTIYEGKIIWIPFVGIVQSVAGKTGQVDLTKYDVKLSNVDNTADLDKPISNATNIELQRHYSAENPHNITKTTIGLENVENTADLDKPVSNAVKLELENKVSWNDVEQDAAEKGLPISFTDTQYSVGDGGLTEFNFSRFYKDFIDNFRNNPRVLALTALTINDDTITLNKGDGTSESITLPDMRFDDQELRTLIEQVSNSIVILDELDSTRTDASLSANQGKVLKEMIDEIKRVTNVDNETFTDLNQIINFIEENREKLDSLKVTNVIGLQEILNEKVNKGSDINTAPNADKLGDKLPEDYVLQEFFNENILNINRTLTWLRTEIQKYETIENVDLKINQSLSELNFNDFSSSINNQIQTLRSSIEALDPSSQLESFQEQIQDISTRVDLLNTNVYAKLNEFQEIINNFDISVIESEFDELRTNTNNSLEQIRIIIQDLYNSNEEFKLQVNNQISVKADIEAVEELQLSIEQKITETNTEVSNKEPRLYSEYIKKRNYNENYDEIVNKIKQIQGNYYTFGTNLFHTAVDYSLSDYFKFYNSPLRLHSSIISPDITGIVEKDESLPAGETNFTCTIQLNVPADASLVNSSFIIGNLFLGNCLRLRAVNLSNKDFIFLNGFSRTLARNKNSLKVRLSIDNTLGRFLDRVSLNPKELDNEQISGFAEDDIFDKIFVDTEFDINYRDADTYKVVGTYNITNNVLSLVFEDYVPSMISITGFTFKTAFVTKGSVNTTLNTSSFNSDGVYIPAGLQVIKIGDFINNEAKKYFAKKQYLLRNINYKRIDKLRKDLEYWNYRKSYELFGTDELLNGF